jgi:phosphoglycolate phosphatase
MWGGAVKIRGILFDKDGTIIDYFRTWVPINREAALLAAGGDASLAAELLRAHGQDPETGAMVGDSVLAVGSIAEIADAFTAHLGARAPAGLTASFQRLFEEGGAKYAVLIPGADRTLATLKSRGLRVGVATNDSVGGLKASLKRTGTLDMLDFAVGYDSGHGTKPAPGMALAFCAAVGLKPAEIAVVGDAMHDLAMGRAASVGLTIGVLSGTGTAAQLQPLADILLDSINDLPALPTFRKSWWRPPLFR